MLKVLDFFWAYSQQKLLCNDMYILMLVLNVKKCMSVQGTDQPGHKGPEYVKLHLL